MINFQTNKIQFSKIIILCCILSNIMGCIAALFLPISEMVSITLITVCGGMMSSAIIFHYRKSQAENTLKIYLSAYEHILHLKHEYNNDGVQDDADDVIENFENKMLNKIDQSFDEQLDNATSIIEKQEIG